MTKKPTTFDVIYQAVTKHAKTILTDDDSAFPNQNILSTEDIHALATDVANELLGTNTKP